MVGYADARADQWTILDPMNGPQETTGIPAYYPVTDDADPPVLRFTGAVAFVI